MFICFNGVFGLLSDITTTERGNKYMLTVNYYRYIKLRYIMRTLSILFLLASLFLLTNCSTENTPSYSLSTNINPSDAGSINPSSGEYDEGTTVEIMASPNENWIFTGWQGDHSGSQNPSSIMMDSDKHIIAQYIKKEYPLTINIEGEGTVQEEVIQQKTTDYPHNTIVQLTANPTEGWKFIEWNGDIEETEKVIEINVDGQKTITAVFEAQSFSIAMHIEGEGSVTLDPDKKEYEPGEEIEATAEAEEGWIFSQWEGDITGNENPINIIIDDNKTFTAIFEVASNTKPIDLPTQGNITLFQANNAPSGLVFVSTEEIAFDDGNDGIWRSDDNGKSWEKTAEINANFITVAANESNLVFAGHDNGYLISQDGGQTWDAGSINNTLSGDPLSLNDAAIVTASDGIFVASSDALGLGLYKSTNLGQSWQHILSTDDVENSGDVWLRHVEISPENSTVIYTATSFNDNIWKLTNGGSSFSSIKSGITISPFVFTDGILVNPSNSQELLIQGHISSDSGSTWNQQDVSPLSNIWIDNTLIKVENNRILTSNNLGNSWTDIMQLIGNNLPNITNPDLFISEDGLFLKSNNDVYKVDLSVIKSNL